MDFDKLYPGRFVKAADFNGKDLTLKISDVRIEELEGRTGPQTKGIVSFEGAKKALVLNRTNGECLKVMFGRETDHWIGKRVTLFPTLFNDEPCIRVRGSPDITESITFDLSLPRKKPKRTTLMKTGSPAAPAQPPPPAQAKQPAGPAAPAPSANRADGEDDPF